MSKIMYIEDFKEIIERIQSDDKKSEVYMGSVSKLDPFLSDFLENNEYSKIHIDQNNYLLNMLFKGNEELYDWMMWFLYDLGFYPTVNTVVGKDGTELEINDLYSFLNFIQKEFDLEFRAK